MKFMRDIKIKLFLKEYLVKLINMKYLNKNANYQWITAILQFLMLKKDYMILQILFLHYISNWNFLMTFMKLLLRMDNNFL